MKVDFRLMKSLLSMGVFAVLGLSVMAKTVALWPLCDNKASPSCDGAWHHVTGVVSNEADKVRMRLFIDYEERANKLYGGNVRRDLESMSLLVGAGFNGLLDEVRFTAKALPVEKFLRRASAPGLTILFR